MYAIRTFIVGDPAEFAVPDGYRVKTVLDYSAHNIQELPNGEMRREYTITVLLEAVAL
jgi:hypothetical protein